MSALQYACISEVNTVKCLLKPKEKPKTDRTTHTKDNEKAGREIKKNDIGCFFQKTDRQQKP